MSFAIKGISDNDFQHLSNFFLNGFDGNQLIEHKSRVNHPLIDGYSYDWYFDGIRMGYSDWYYQQPVALQWYYDIKVELITFQANLKGSLYFGNEATKATQVFGNYQHNLYYSDTKEVNEGILTCDRLRSSLFFIQFTKDAFLSITKDANEAIMGFSEAVINGRPAPLSLQNLTLDATMLNLIHNIVHCQYKGGLKKMYLLSKSIEFLVLQAEAYNATLKPTYQYIRSQYDKDCIIYAREYVLNHLEMPPSLSELAKIVGINEYKLKRGFKEVYQNTVFGYLSDARLEIAKNHLLANAMPISEIASDLGYSSVQHFSNAFKKKFGIPPSRLR